jgi:hypothetical protein
MSHVTPTTFYRIAGTAGFGSALVLFVNAAKRADVIPTSTFTQLVAPLAQILALAFISALYVRFGRRAGTFGLVAYLVNAVALASLIGVEFVINLVFNDLPKSTVDDLRAGALGIALTAASVLFLIGTLTFVAAMIQSREIPTAPLAMYAIGAVPVSLRAFVPEVALDLGLVTLAGGIGWLAIWLLDSSGQIDTWTMRESEAVERVAV